MISNLSSCIVEILIRNNTIKIEQALVYQYGFEIFISSAITCLITLLCGIVFQCFLAAIMYFTLFVTLRTICGGYHARTYWQCNLLFSFVTIAVLLIYTFAEIEEFIELHYCIVVLSIIITAIYAPVENKNKKLTKKQKKNFRIISMATILILNTISCLLLVIYSSSYAILIDMTVLSVSVSMFITEPMKGGENEYDV